MAIDSGLLTRIKILRNRHGILLISYTSKFCNFCFTQPFLSICNVICGNIVKFYTIFGKFSQALLAHYSMSGFWAFLYLSHLFKLNQINDLIFKPCNSSFQMIKKGRSIFCSKLSTIMFGRLKMFNMLLCVCVCHNFYKGGIIFIPSGEFSLFLP